MTRGSAEPPKFLEIHYNPFGDQGVDVAPLVFVGKGVTFDRYLPIARLINVFPHTSPLSVRIAVAFPSSHPKEWA